MAEILKLPYGQTLTLDDLHPPCAVYQWKRAGKLEVEQIPGVGTWSYIPDDKFDWMVASADGMAKQLTYERVYIIGRPE